MEEDLTLSQVKDTYSDMMGVTLTDDLVKEHNVLLSAGQGFLTTAGGILSKIYS